MKKDYSILIGGEAGQGSRKAGLVIAKLLNRFGYRIFIYDDYQSLIRGGHNFSKIRASEKEVLSHREKIDFLLALDQHTVDLHKKDLDANGVVIFNSDKIKKENGIGVPIEQVTKDLGGIPVMANTALIAAFAKIIGIDFDTLKIVLTNNFKKGLDLNLKIAEEAYSSTRELIKIERINQESLPLLTGNEAVALGAVKAGLDMYIAYPMTPATGILHYLAAHQKDFNIAVCQLENEIGVINSAIGGAAAGARTMVATSGGGFALMTEALSLAAQSETPVVIVESQRAAPATGVPTYTAQSDLLFALNAGHGDFLRFVAAPGDADECFYWAGKILNLAWKFQTPAILLIDKEVSESTFNFHKDVSEKVKYETPSEWDKNGEYKRYKDTEDGISPLAFFGDDHVVSKVTSYEHDEFGVTVEDSEDDIKRMQDKRLRKFQKMREEAEELESVKVYGNTESPTAIIVWGSTRGPAKEAGEKLGLKVIQPILIEPFPEKQIKKALKGVKKLISLETNAFGQLEMVLNRFGIRPDKRILKYTSRPFLPEEIERELKKIL